MLLPRSLPRLAAMAQRVRAVNRVVSTAAASTEALVKRAMGGPAVKGVRAGSMEALVKKGVERAYLKVASLEPVNKRVASLPAATPAGQARFPTFLLEMESPRPRPCPYPCPKEMSASRLLQRPPCYRAAPWLLLSLLRVLFTTYKGPAASPKRITARKLGFDQHLGQDDNLSGG